MLGQSTQEAAGRSEMHAGSRALGEINKQQRNRHRGGRSLQASCETAGSEAAESEPLLSRWGGTHGAVGIRDPNIPRDNRGLSHGYTRVWRSRRDHYRLRLGGLRVRHLGRDPSHAALL
jgi:hypothetical protein